MLLCLCFGPWDGSELFNHDVMCVCSVAAWATSSWVTAREKNLSSPCLRQVSDQGFPLGREHRAEQSRRQGLLFGETRTLDKHGQTWPPTCKSCRRGPSSLPPAHDFFVGSSDLTPNNPHISYLCSRKLLSGFGSPGSHSEDH